MNEKILVVEDDHVISHFLDLVLRSKGYVPLVSETGFQALGLFISETPSLVLLDLGLPDLDGMEVLARLRESSKGTPIIIVSAREKEDEKVAALDHGADDYLTKPFNVGELLARIRVALRHRPFPDEEQPFSYRQLKVDFAKRVVLLGEEEVHLTPIEFKLLSVLIENQGKVLTHKFLQEKIWGYETSDDYQSLRVFMASLRKKIAPPTDESYILTEIGVGYRFRED
jgi:Response regulators consisting of a CheY-like receiver domain and a winged-helix DNA-binding domain